MILALDGPPHEVFTELVRALPDGEEWLISAMAGTVAIARHEGELVREAILTDLGDGRVEIEALCSQAVNEAVLEGLVVASVVVGMLGLLSGWFMGPGGLMGLILTVVLAGTLPTVFMAIAQRWVDPGRDAAAEANLVRGLEWASSQLPQVSWVEPAP